jgi:hypothetical protein
MLSQRREPIILSSSTGLYPAEDPVEDPVDVPRTSEAPPKRGL